MNVTYTHHMSIARQHEAHALAYCVRAIAANYSGDDKATRDAAQRATRLFEDAIEQTFAAMRGLTTMQRSVASHCMPSNTARSSRHMARDMALNLDG